MLSLNALFQSSFALCNQVQQLLKSFEEIFSCSSAFTPAHTIPGGFALLCPYRIMDTLLKLSCRRLCIFTSIIHRLWHATLCCIFSKLFFLSSPASNNHWVYLLVLNLFIVKNINKVSLNKGIAIEVLFDSIHYEITIFRSFCG